MVFGSHAKTRAMYSTPPCPSLAASTAAYRRLSFSDNHPKKRCIFPSISAEYTSMSYSLLRDLLRSQDTTAQAIREVILDHILSQALHLGYLLSPHSAFQGHAAHTARWPAMLSPNGSSDTCISAGVFHIPMPCLHGALPVYPQVLPHSSRLLHGAARAPTTTPTPPLPRASAFRHGSPRNYGPLAFPPG